MYVQNHSNSTYSFNPQHRSGTFSPYSNEETPLDFHRALRSPVDFQPTTKDKPMDKTVSEWLNHPGYRSSRQANMHPKSPDPARLDELSKVNRTRLIHTRKKN